jgi:AcrR family transcriptional regulator
VDDISHEAGYSKGAYYFHFSTKDDILLELLRMWTEGRSDILRASIEGGEGDLRQTLTGFFSYEAASPWPAVLLEFWSQAVRNNEVSKRLTQAYAGWRKQIGDAFEQASASGLRVESAEDAAAVALAAHDGYAVQIAIGHPGGRGMTPAELADSILTPIEQAGTERRSAAM